MSSRDRSRSPPVGHHSCWVAVTTEHKEQFEATNIIHAAWFGDGRCVVVKDSLYDAIEAFCAGANSSPDFVITIHLTFDMSRKFIHDGTMTRVNCLNGYRIYSDLDLRQLELGCVVEPVVG